MVESVRHRSRRHKGLSEKLSGRKVRWRSRSAERRQHVEAPDLQIVASEHHAALPVEMPCQARDPGKNLERAHVDSGQSPSPSLHEPIDLVFHGAPLRLRTRPKEQMPTGPELYLDIKMTWTDTCLDIKR